MLIDLPDATNFRPGAVRTTEGFRGLGFSGPGAHCWISGLALALVGIGRLGLKLKGFMASGRLLGAVKNL